MAIKPAVRQSQKWSALGALGVRSWVFAQVQGGRGKPVHACGGQRGGEDGHGTAEGEGIGEVEARQGNSQREARRLDKPGQRKCQ